MARFRPHLLPLCLLLAGVVRAQPVPVDLTSGTRSTRASLMAVYERFTEEDSASVSQLSLPVALELPLGYRWSVGFRASRMATSGEGIENVSGLSDAQVVVRYARPVGDGSIVLALGANLPVGQTELSAEEFRTVVLLSRSSYAYETQSLGQGAGLSPSVTWAFPAGERVALGVGAAYQVRGSYRPLDSVPEDYSPGDEALFTVGADVKIGRTSALSVDVSHTLYAADRLGDMDVYQPGNKTTAAVLVRGFRGYDEWRLLGVYRSRAKSDLLAGVDPVTGDDRVLPNELTLQGSYGMRWGASARGTLLLRLRSYEETPVYPSRTVVDIGVLPALRLSPTVSVPARAVYTLGTISGLEVGVGLALDL